MAKILIVGASGFIGSNVANWLMLHTNHTLVGIDAMNTFPDLLNLQPVINSKRFNFYLADARNKDIVEKIFRVENPDHVLDVSCEYDFQIQEALAYAVAKHPVEKLVSVLDKFRRYGPGIVELVQELMPKAIIAYSCGIYGPRQHKNELIPNAMWQYLNNRTVDPKSLTNRCSEWLYVKDLFLAISLLFRAGKPGVIYEVSGHSASENEIVEKLAAITGNDVELILTDFNTMEENVSAVNISELGWKPTHGLDDSLEHTAVWYSQNKWSYRLGIEHGEE